MKKRYQIENKRRVPLPLWAGKKVIPVGGTLDTHLTEAKASALRNTAGVALMELKPPEKAKEKAKVSKPNQAAKKAPKNGDKP
jgi:hypothetical protein